jgi:predicted enzyme related to lactoylglutathione lyase
MLHEGVFSWYELRTTDVDAAAAFYADVAGWRVAPGELEGTRELQRDGQAVASIGPLPELARARGAPAHWMGHIHVGDVEEAVRRFVAAGGQPLGPLRELRDARVAAVRDATGAVLALASGRGARAAAGAIAWHELHSPVPERAFATYATLFGWVAGAAIDLGPPLGAYQTFAWRAGGTPAGAVASNAHRTEVHAQWVL